MSRSEHWDGVYATKSVDAVSWYQEHAALSLRLIEESGEDRGAPIIDVGGGASTLIGSLLEAGHTDITVLDISAHAIEAAKARLGEQAVSVHWMVADVTEVVLPEGRFSIWHDRAVLHFLTEEADRALYIGAVRAALKPGGIAIIATFAEDGPDRCSGLPVMKYSEKRLSEAFSEGFQLVRSVREGHLTPAGTTQSFIYCVLQRL